MKNLFSKENTPSGLFEVDKNFQTPLKVVDEMVKMIPAGARTVLEPTPGLGHIVSRLKGYEVTAPEDFFLMEKQRFDCIVMNPPFSDKYAFMDNAPDNKQCKGMKLGYFILKQCMAMSDNVISLVPWYTISDSDLRLKFLTDFGIKSITALPRKTFKYARIQTCILELHKGFEGDTIFRKFNF